MSFLDGASIDPAVRERWPDYAVFLVTARGIHGAESDTESDAALADAEAFASSLTATIEEIPQVAAWRAAFREFGVKRFRTRDHVVVTGTDCSCGRTGYKIRCVGRTDDMLIVRGINVYPSAVRELVLGSRPDATGEMRIRADFEGHSTQRPLPLGVECRDGLEDDGRRRLQRDIEERVRSALNARVVVELVEEGTLERPDHVKVALVERPF